MVLKLHGSVGWHLASDGIVYFSSPYFLQSLDFHYQGKKLPLFDPLEPKIGPDRERILAYPSFLKQLVSPEIQRIWYLAGSFLGQAKSVEFYGYSLPDSDLAVRVLLGPLRCRIEKGEVAAAVHDPNRQVQERWLQLLRDRTHTDGQKLGD